MYTTKYLTTKECNELFGIKSVKIRELCNDNYLDFYKESGRLFINEESLKLYIQNHDKIRQGAFGNIRTDPKIAYYLIKGYDYMYATTSDGRVVNFSNGLELSMLPNKEKNHIQVWLMKNGKVIPRAVHQLIVETQGDNVLRKIAIHHIDGNPTNNVISNLLPVYDKEHIKLHNLLRKNLKKEYKEMVKKIKKDNKQKIYKIKHPDYSSDERFDYWLWLNAEGYKAYKDNGQILISCIVRESATEKQDRKD